GLAQDSAARVADLEDVVEEPERIELRDEAGEEARLASRLDRVDHRERPRHRAAIEVIAEGALADREEEREEDDLNEREHDEVEHGEPEAERPEDRGRALGRTHGAGPSLRSAYPLPITVSMRRLVPARSSFRRSDET